MAIEFSSFCGWLSLLNVPTNGGTSGQVSGTVVCFSLVVLVSFKVFNMSRYFHHMFLSTNVVSRFHFQRILQECLWRASAKLRGPPADRISTSVLRRRGMVKLDPYGIV